MYFVVYVWLIAVYINQELMKSIDDLARDSFGRKVLLYLLAPRDPLHFHPDIVNILQQGDANTNRLVILS